MFGTLSALPQTNPSKSTPLTSTEKSADPEKQAAISRLPSALIDELDEPGHPEQSSAVIISVPPTESLTETEIEVQSKYTMAQMAELEWASIEKYVSAVLPARGRTREALRKTNNSGNYKMVS